MIIVNFALRRCTVQKEGNFKELSRRPSEFFQQYMYAFYQQYYNILEK